MQVHAKSMEEQGKINQRLLEEQQGVKEEQKVIMSQLTKLTNLLTVQEQGYFSSQPQPNPRGQHMAQTSNPDKQHVKETNVIITRSGKEIDGPTPASNLIPNTTSNKDEAPNDQEAPSDSMSVPFPQALLKPKERNFALKGEILEQLKQVRINLPFLHTPPKYKDPGYPTVACQIGNQACGQVLLDLGASVNLMPYSIYLQLGLGEIKPTTVVLQLADHSVRKPRGIVEDVLVQIDKFYYPVDFLVLDTIAIDEYIKVDSNSLDFLLDDFDIDDSCSHAVNIVDVFDMSQGFVKKSWQPCFEELPNEREPPKPSSEEVPTPTLAPLPKGLKHAFLGPGDIFPVIISSELSDVQSDKLLDLLREHKSALG
ncbi:hypothetical protein UlMin_013998 [Ulmus minor]